MTYNIDIMSLLYWLLVGLAAGSLAKMITPQKEDPGWLSSLVVGIIGSVVGGFLSGIIGLKQTNLIGSLIIATIGAVIVLFLWHRYKANKAK
ncbi:MAG: GlsB/YeaQ/YmgE family stress response membrane protein [Bacteroidota bacterium]